jgi:DNA (cytosine-5)-methyltransferase 1
MLTHIDLFSGIGGFALAAQRAGFRTAVFCENDPFCQEVLGARFGAVADAEGGRFTGTESKRNEKETSRRREHSTIEPNKARAAADPGGREVRGTGKSKEMGEHKSVLIIPDVRDFDGTRSRGATLLTGGFPCQPFSCAGKRRGKADDRWLWPEMLRIISEARPTWVLGENVAGIVNMELEQVCVDLEAEGYEVQPIIIPACAVNAPHRRMRVWIVGHRDGAGLHGSLYNEESSRGIQQESLQRHRVCESPDSDAPDTEISERNRGGRTWTGGQRPSDNGWDTPWPEVAARLCRVDARVSRRVDRLRALGNAIVPAVAYEIIKEIARIEWSGQK